MINNLHTENLWYILGNLSQVEDEGYLSERQSYLINDTIEFLKEIIEQEESDLEAMVAYFEGNLDV